MYKQYGKVSEIDIKNLKIIRDGVDSLLKETAEIYDREGAKVLDIAPQDWEGAKKFYKKSYIDTLDIDPNSNATFIADITKNNRDIIPDEYYDVVICTEVLEHTLNPFAAVNEIYRILKVEGVLVMTTPFNFRIHGPLPDCWRFTEYGLRELLKKFRKVDIRENGTDRFLCPVQYKVIAIK